MRLDPLTNFARPIHSDQDKDLPSRRRFLRTASLAGTAPVLARALQALAAIPATDSASTPFDAKTMRELADWTALSFDTDNPTPIGGQIVDSKTGAQLVRTLNMAYPHHDPSAHGEVTAIRLACAQLQSQSLKGYTLYTTCEPCAMCMSLILYAGLDRVVYGAVLDDAWKVSAHPGLLTLTSAEVKSHSNSTCAVVGPVEHERCAALFVDPRLVAVRKQRLAKPN